MSTNYTNRDFAEMKRRVMVQPEPDEIEEYKQEARENRALVRTLLRRLYDTERRLDERNFAKGHSFEEWLERESQ